MVALQVSKASQKSDSKKDAALNHHVWIIVLQQIMTHVLLFCGLGTEKCQKCSLFLENQTLPQKSSLMKATLRNFAHYKTAGVAKTGFRIRNIDYLSLTTEKLYL